MLAVTLNPGFVLMLAALVVLALPRIARAPAMAAAALAAMWLLLEPEFGAARAVAQMGLAVVPFTLDELNQVFGIAFIAATVMLALYSSARRNRYEDAAIMMLAGAATTALFVGDLVFFIAAAALAGLAAAWVVLASPHEGAGEAGVRLLIWHGLEGLLFLAGVAFQLSSGADNSVLARLSVDHIGGALIFAALMIRVGAPLAHVWLKDVVAHASGAGGAALSCFASLLGVYALARLFPTEGLLVPIGAAMIGLGVFFAAAEDDLRRAAAYGVTAQAGVCVALIGVGSPLSVAAAEAHAFTIVFAFALLQMALGAMLDRVGATRFSQLPGAGRAMPVTTALIFLGGAAAAGLPGLVTYASLALALEASAQWETRLLWGLISAAPAALFICLALRPTLAAHVPTPKPARFREAPFTMLLSAGLGAFLCFAVGVTPSWLYSLMPTELDFAPFALDRLAPQLELLGAASITYVVLRMLRVAPKERAVRLYDVDALYRGPVAGAGRWTGVVMLRLYGAWRDALTGAGAQVARGFAVWAGSWDRPFAGRWTGALQFASIGAVLLIILLTGQ